MRDMLRVIKKSSLKRDVESKLDFDFSKNRGVGLLIEN